jgi:sodium transport system ATP-binding protein
LHWPPAFFFLQSKAARIDFTAEYAESAENILFCSANSAISAVRRMAAIEVENLTKEYLDKARGVVRAVDGISLQCEYGEIVGLLGPNGAGKTTTLRTLATVLTPTHGHARVAGFDVIRDSQQVRKNLGFLTGGTGLYARLTPREILQFFGRLHEMSADSIRTRTNNLIELFDMSSFQNSHCDKLSTGQKQRVNLARTLLHDPNVIILDEPTAGLDIISSKTILDFIRSAKQEGKCILFSTHYMTEAEILCDRVAIIHNGKILDCDTLRGLSAKTGKQTLVDVFFHLIQQYETQQN